MYLYMHALYRTRSFSYTPNVRMYLYIYILYNIRFVFVYIYNMWYIMDIRVYSGVVSAHRNVEVLNARGIEKTEPGAQVTGCVITQYFRLWVPPPQRPANTNNCILYTYVVCVNVCLCAYVSAVYPPPPTTLTYNMRERFFSSPPRTHCTV